MKLFIPIIVIVSIISSLATLIGVGYFHENKLGFTQISSTDLVSNFPTTYNTNLANTVAVGTTSVASITTLSNLSLPFSQVTGNVPVSQQGTGTTSPSVNQIMFGNGASGLTVIGLGTSGQVLQSQGAGSLPTWTTSAIDQAGNYTWTGNHIFTRSTTTNATTTNLQISGYGSTSVMTIGALGVGIATTTQRNADIAGDLRVRGICTGCSQMSSSSQSTALVTVDGNATSALATCPAGYLVTGGGWINSIDQASYVPVENKQWNATQWFVMVVCDTNITGACNAGNLVVYATCIKNY